MRSNLVQTRFWVELGHGDYLEDIRIFETRDKAWQFIVDFIAPRIGYEPSGDSSRDMGKVYDLIHQIPGCEWRFVVERFHVEVRR